MPKRLTATNASVVSYRNDLRFLEMNDIPIPRRPERQTHAARHASIREYVDAVVEDMIALEEHAEREWEELLSDPDTQIAPYVNKRRGRLNSNLPLNGPVHRRAYRVLTSRRSPHDAC